jgi:limonene-1,2-epoxide hydrolase
LFMATRPKGQHSREQLALVRRQIALWETNEDHGALADWALHGILTAPRGVSVATHDIPTVINGWHRQFRDLHIDLTTLAASANGNWLAIEWTWTVTRRSDGARSVTPDAIVVELRRGKIVQWREYFDTFGSVEFAT